MIIFPKPAPEGVGFLLCNLHEKNRLKLGVLHRKTFVHPGNYTILHFDENKH